MKKTREKTGFLAAFLPLFLLTGCTIFFSGRGPETKPTDTLVYFLLDVTELPGDFHKAVLHSADGRWSTGTAWDPDLEKGKKYIVCYSSIPNDQPVYFSEIHGVRSGFLTGTKYEMYVMTPQESPLRVKRTKEKAGIRYGGAFEFKLQEGGLLKANKFYIRPCAHCPGEKEILGRMATIGDEGGELLAENSYLAKVKSRLKSLGR